MRKITYIDPHEVAEGVDAGYTLGAPEKMPPEITHPEAIELWEAVMRRVVDEKGKTVLRAPDTASQALTRAIYRFWDDEEHIAEKFEGKRPTAKELYTAACFSRSKWNRIISGELIDVERGNIFALAVALRLNDTQTEALLHAAGFALNYELDLDAAMMYFIKNESYDLPIIFEILGQFCSCTEKNGLDCFIFRPVNDRQRRAD